MNRTLIFAALSAAVLTTGCFNSGADAQDGESGEAGWMRIGDQTYPLETGRCGEIFDGEEYIVQGEHEDHFVKARFPQLQDAEGYDFENPFTVQAGLSGGADAPYYIPDRSDANFETSGSREGAQGSIGMVGENDPAREQHPDGVVIAFEIDCTVIEDPA